MYSSEVALANLIASFTNGFQLFRYYLLNSKEEKDLYCSLNPHLK